MDQKPRDPGSAPNQDRPDEGKERDFGDSAGYGSGGSTLDRRDVGDDDPTSRRPNPLDEVIPPSPSDQE
jgi:hypothetical protein